MAAEVGRLDDAAHAASSAELAFLAAAGTVDCQEQFYSATAAWVAGDARALDISGACAPRPLAPVAVATRRALVQAVVLYGDKLAAMTRAGGAQPLNGGSLLPAAELGALARSSNLRLNDAALSPVVQTGIGALAGLALGQIIYRDAGAAARAMQPHVAAVVLALQSENFAIGQAMAASLGKIEIVLRGMIARSRRPVTPQQESDAFFRIVNAQAILSGTNPLRPEARQTPDEASRPSDPALPLNTLWSDVLRENAAVAAGAPDRHEH